MADKNVVLDTSAVIALLCDEEGADCVENYLLKAKKGGASVFISFATVSEVFSSAIKAENQERAELYLANMKSWPVTWIHSTEELCLSAGSLKAQYRMSFADSFIASTALHLNAILVHKDPEFECLDGILRMEILPYKNRKA